MWGNQWRSIFKGGDRYAHYIFFHKGPHNCVNPPLHAFQAYFLCIEGAVEIEMKEKIELKRYDAAEIVGGQKFVVVPKPDAENSSKAHFLIVEMEFAGDGRKDL
jgi:hypothetical protein